MEGKTQPKWDLYERTKNFANKITERLIPQLIGASTSIGANYCEADNAESKRDFIHKIGICKKESRETVFFLEIIATAVPHVAAETTPLRQEAIELNLIFNAIQRKIKTNQNEILDQLDIIRYFNYGSLAQLVEQLPLKQTVLGSIPRRPTRSLCLSS